MSKKYYFCASYLSTIEVENEDEAYELFCQELCGVHSVDDFNDIDWSEAEKNE